LRRLRDRGLLEKQCAGSRTHYTLKNPEAIAEATNTRNRENYRSKVVTIRLKVVSRRPKVVTKSMKVVTDACHHCRQVWQSGFPKRAKESQARLCAH